jgi:hypothetical protein
VAMTMPIQNDANLTISRAEMRALLAEFEVRITNKLRPLWVMSTVNLMLVSAIAVKVFF